MRRTTYILLAVCVLGVAGLGCAQPAQDAAAESPESVSLLFRETFQTVVGLPPDAPTRIPLTEQHATNANLEMQLYGPGAEAAPDHESGLLLQLAADAAQPGEGVSYVWSGVTEDRRGMTLRDRNNYLDLRGPAKIRWRTRARSLHQLRLLVKLADGTMLAADYVEPEASYWRETEFYLVDVPRWRALDGTRMAVSGDSEWKMNVDLSRVDEVGFTDLMRGGGFGTRGNSGVDWIEVYGNLVTRATSQD